MQNWKTELELGYRRFQAGMDGPAKMRYAHLGGDGQKPKVMLIGCADSRVEPQEIFDQQPGDMFVMRNVANIVPPFGTVAGMSLAAGVAFAIEKLKVEALVIMGHSKCGGVEGCLNDLDMATDTPLGQWLSFLTDLKVQVLAQIPADASPTQTLELANISQSCAALKEYPLVKAALQAGHLKIQGVYFDIAAARLIWADDAGRFTL